MSLPIVSLNVSFHGSDSRRSASFPCADQAVDSEHVHDLVLKHRRLVVRESEVGERGFHVGLKVFIGFFRLVAVSFIEWHPERRTPQRRGQPWSPLCDVRKREATGFSAVLSCWSEYISYF
jgi:hypothetical protein